MNEALIEKAINRAMDELKVSKRRAIAEFLVFMCGYGTIEDFRDVINYIIKNQERERT